MIVRHRPVSQEWEWQLHAVCRGLDSSVFYSPQGERGIARRAREAHARAICAQCPVKQTCADVALLRHEDFGFWGGMSEQERRALRSKNKTDTAA